ncbi:DUF1569 domain-containing protein [Cyclobacterium roseum]|uniref:DUF1569 domain-containing protein n=1 Tax=Cyclobacterium roseum TaxID=2666137 RepID=UPI001390BB3E|nr:DUF1569 domain-containing protein [Cyclobacterium roseum]
MQRSVLDSSAVAGLMARVALLTAQTKPSWGRMNATEMLHHCNLANQRILSWNKPVLPGSFKQKALKFLILHILPSFPKNVKTAAPFETKGKIKPEVFEEEKLLFVSCLQQFAEPGQGFTAPHPFFGPLNTKEWGKVVWLHVDHHLRQFGL